MGSVLANLSSCVTVVFFFACALGWIGWLSTFLFTLPLPMHRGDVASFQQAAKNIIPPPHQCQHIPSTPMLHNLSILLQPQPKLCIPFQLFSSPHSWTERFKSYIDCTYYISPFFLHIASSLSHHHHHLRTILSLSPPFSSKTDETETHCITPLLTLTAYIRPSLPPLSSDHLYIRPCDRYTLLSTSFCHYPPVHRDIYTKWMEKNHCPDRKSVV